MDTKVYKDGQFVVVNQGTQTTNFPLSNFQWRFIGETDTLRLESKDQAKGFSATFSEIQNEAGDAVGDKDAVTTYLNALPANGGGTGGSVTITANETDYSTGNKQDEAKTELEAIKQQLQSLKDLITQNLPEAGNTKSFSGNQIQDLGLGTGPVMGKLVQIADYGSGSVVFEVDGIANPVTDDSPRVTGTSSSFGPIEGIDLTKVRFRGTSNGSTYYITYVTYKTV